MLDLLFRILSCKFSRDIKILRPLPISLTVSITRKCNLRCRTCNIWREEAKDEMTAAEYRRIFLSLKKRIFWITFDGGEPFLRDDIDEIVQDANELLRPLVINIATNGVLSNIIFAKVRKISETCPGVQIIINLSIDGRQKEHDEIRGTKDAFNKALETYHKLKTLRRRNLCVGINTTVSKFNFEKLSEIITFCQNLAPDSYLAELAENRDEFNNLKCAVRPEDEQCLKAMKIILHKTTNIKHAHFSAMTQKLRRQYYFRIKEILEGTQMPFPCFAGTAFAHIFPAGDVWGCCTRKRMMGNLRAEGYDFRKVWKGEKSDGIRQEVAASRCYCTSVNAYYINMLCNIAISPSLGVRYLFWKLSMLEDRHEMTPKGKFKRIVN